MSTIRFLSALLLLGASLPSNADCPDSFSVTPLTTTTNVEVIAAACISGSVLDQGHSINGSNIDVWFVTELSQFPIQSYTVYESVGALPVGIYTVTVTNTLETYPPVSEQFTVHVNAPSQSTGTSVPTLGVWGLALLVLMMSALFGIKIGRQ